MSKQALSSLRRLGKNFPQKTFYNCRTHMDKFVVNQQKQADLEEHFNAGTKRVSGSFVRKYFLLGEQQRKSFFKNPVRWASLLRKRLRLRPWQAGLKHKEVFIGREQVLLIIALGVAQ